MGLLGSLRGPLGASWKPLGTLLGASWDLLGASWGLLGASWGPSWDPLGALWSLSGALEAVGKPFGRSWKPFGSLKGSPKDTPNRPPRQQKSLSERIPRATAHYVQMPINLDRYFHEVKECRKSAHPLTTSMFTVFYEGFFRVAFFALACIGSAKHRWNASKKHRSLS